MEELKVGGKEDKNDDQILEQTEIYAFIRPFKEVCEKLPGSFAHALTNIGVGHYLAVVRESDGSIYQLEFGPVGGETQLLGIKLGAQNKQLSSGYGRQLFRVAQKGEVHLENLEEVPQNSLKIGYSEKSANDILNYITNLNEHDLAYCLHSNDCRHFLNKICEYAAPQNSGRNPSTLVWQHRLAQTKEDKASPGPMLAAAKAFAVCLDVRHGIVLRSTSAALSVAVSMFAVSRVMWIASMAGAPIVGIVSRIIPRAKLITAAAAAAQTVDDHHKGPLWRLLSQRAKRTNKKAAVKVTPLAEDKLPPNGFARRLSSSVKNSAQRVTSTVSTTARRTGGAVKSTVGNTFKYLFRSANCAINLVRRKSTPEKSLNLASETTSSKLPIGKSKVGFHFGRSWRRNHKMMMSICYKGLTGFKRHQMKPLSQSSDRVQIQYENHRPLMSGIFWS